ncbi:MAG: 4-hydroxythreonine-4-phosphate dehydrogenase PdxA [Saprospiraceae bacterium]
MNKIKVGISAGDINGVGLEVILKSLAQNITDFCTPIIYCSSKIVAYHKNIVGIESFHFSSSPSAHGARDGRINVVNCWQDDVTITLGKLSETGGKYARIALEQATNDLQEGLIDALITAPINKKAMQMAGFQYPGHTEFLADRFNINNSLMLMVSDKLRIGLVTNHLPIKDVASAITKDRVAQKLALLNTTLKRDFGLDKPTIAVLGLNPHAGDDGAIGSEEEEIIRPAVVEAKKSGIMAMGPYAADGFFGSGQHKKFDGILAMYHDQGLVAFKSLTFGNGVNFTAGLPHVRTSPDHGTGYDIAGTNSADHSSFLKALYLALDVSKHRKEFDLAHEDKVSKSVKHSEK